MRRSVFVVDTRRLEIVKASLDAGKISIEIFYDNLPNITKERDYTILDSVITLAANRYKSDLR